MVAINPKTGKKYCDLFCYMCEGYVLKPCLMTKTNDSMKMLMAKCLGKGLLLILQEPRAGYWHDQHTITPDMVNNTNDYPTYVIKKHGTEKSETCH